MKKKFLPITVTASILLLSILFSCRKEMSTGTDGTIPTTVGTPILPTTPVTGSVSGIVIDENNAPIALASVTVAGVTYVTDAKGFFNTGKHTLDKYISTVQVNVPGYFKAVRSFYANPARNYVAIKLIPKTLAGSFSSSATGNIALPNGSQINFTAGSIVNKSTGAPYTGNVKVYSAYIDPTSADIATRVPGSFIGQDNINMYALASAGMIAVELESDAGVPLQLATGQSAAIKLLIPPSLVGSAPATINTWSLDDRGVWKKETNNAVKNGNYYEWQASHFSYWNCDIPLSSIYLRVHLTDQHNEPLSNTYVDIRPPSVSVWSSAGGLTDSAGNGTAFVPANQILKLSVYGNANICGTSFYDENIGSYTTNTNINVAATIVAPMQISVQGTAINCTGTPLQSGTALIYSSQGVYHVPITDGNFHKTIYSCTPVASVNIIAIDHNAPSQSNTATVNVINNTATAGILNACAIYTNEYLDYTLDGVNSEISLTGAAAQVYAAVRPGISTLINGYQHFSRKVIFLTSGTAVGSFGVSSDSLSINMYNDAQPATSAVINFTDYGTASQYVQGNFNIPFTHTSTGATVHSCTGSFRIRRN